MHRQELLQLLANHFTHFMDEAGYIDRARAFVQAHPDCFNREHLPGHVTGSAWVISPDRQRVLMMHHRKHNQWFQPGGLDPAHVHLLDGSIFDVDIHTIPASGRGPQHEHVDIRFLVEIDDSRPVPGSDESHEVLWVRLNDVSRYNNNRSTWRMTEKTRRLRSQIAQRKTA
jgi:8-oxo-dGTP pyrophosphatase MutT (NUDIX family)